VPRAALFFHEGLRQASNLARALGCPLNPDETIRTTRLKGASCPGVWVAGDAAMDIHLAIMAAADGARAGFAINLALQREERQ
jgi:thioredoxin reductase